MKQLTPPFGSNGPKVRLQVDITVDQYKILKEEGEKYNLSVPLFCKEIIKEFIK